MKKQIPFPNVPKGFDLIALYGRNTGYADKSEDCRIYHLNNETGAGTITIYYVFQGVRATFNDIHMEYCNQAQVYALHFSEPQVILYAHNDDEAPEIIGHTFEEFLFLQLLDAIANEEEKNGVHFQENCKFLSPAEQAFFMEKQEDALIAYYDQLEPEYAQIWED